MLVRRIQGSHRAHLFLALVFATGAFVAPAPPRVLAAPTAPSGYVLTALHQYQYQAPGYLWGLAYRSTQKDLLVAVGASFQSLDPATGTILKVVPTSNGDSAVYNLTVASDGSVAITTDGSIELFNAALTLTGSIPQPGTARVPRGIAFDSTGALYVANGSSIYKYSAPVTSSSIPTTYSSTFGFVEGIAIDEIDGLFVADSQNNVVRYSRGGYANVTSPVAVASIHLYSTYAYATSAQCGFTPSTTCTSGAVYRVDTGQLAATLFSSGFTLPTGIALDPDLDIYVADRRTSTLWKFMPTAPTVASVSRFTAVRHGGRLALNWRLRARGRVAGFNLYAGRHRLNGILIPQHRRLTYTYAVTRVWSGPYMLGIVLPGGREIFVQAAGRDGIRQGLR